MVRKKRKFERCVQGVQEMKKINVERVQESIQEGHIAMQWMDLKEIWWLKGR